MVYKHIEISEKENGEEGCGRCGIYESEGEEQGGGGRKVRIEIYEWRMIEVRERRQCRVANK